MEITQVVVNIHEKRNHPHEYGHYDASVTFTAWVEPEEDAGAVTELLRARARRQVFAECDAWGEKIREDHRISRLLGDFNLNINQLSWQTDKRVERCNEIIAKLPEEMQAEHRERLKEAIDQLPPKEAAPEEVDYPEYYEDEEEIGF